MLPLSCSLQSNHTSLLTAPQTHQVYSYLRIFACPITFAFPIAVFSLLRFEFKPHFFKDTFLEYSLNNHSFSPVTLYPIILYFPQCTQHYFLKSYLFDCPCVFSINPTRIKSMRAGTLTTMNIMAWHIVGVL